MDDSTTSSDNKTNSRIPLGMSSFGVSEWQQFGQNIRLAMACIEGSAEPVNTKAMSSNAMPSDEASIRQRLKELSHDITYHADLLELLVRYEMIWKVGKPVGRSTALPG